jgi:hypothetical protein
MSAMALEKELDTYRKHLPEWKDSEGKFVLIHGEEVGGIFTSYEDAIKEGYEKYKLTPFLVKQINAFEQVHFISRLFDPCHTSQSK